PPPFSYLFPRLSRLEESTGKNIPATSRPTGCHNSGRLRVDWVIFGPAFRPIVGCNVSWVGGPEHDVVFRRAELREESDESMYACSGLAAHNPDFVQSAVRPIDGFVPPRAHPLAKTLISPED